MSYNRHGHQQMPADVYRQRDAGQEEKVMVGEAI
jgi:hypothetical protein